MKQKTANNTPNLGVCLQSEKRIISSLFSIIYRFSLFFGKGAVSKMVKSGNVANISYLMI
ncbi:hypothetical protein IQN08_06520 [Enterococcus faecium]|nr:hypothetical protein IQN08_06520 [Enterococcus faecium]